MKTRTLAGILFGCVLVISLAPGNGVPAGSTSGDWAPPRGLQVAEMQQIMEQMETEFVARAQVDVWRSPNEQSRRIATLLPGEKVLVTGRITVDNWYRVYIQGPGIGYVQGAYLGADSGELPSAAPESATTGEIQTAVVAPVKPALETPTEPAVARFDPPRDGFQDCGHCPHMVPIMAGEFDMGSAAGDVTERPVHRVRIARKFALGRYEVTVAQWRVCFEAGACSFEPDDVAVPERTAVRNISWDDAREYVAWLAKTTGKPYRLPSEAEWEYAARAGSGSEYWWGDVVDHHKTACKDCGGAWDHKAAGDIGRFAPNPFGLYDVSGGVAEWTADCWVKNYAKAPADGSARDQADCQQRVLRGGSWRNEAGYLRSATRLYYDANVNYTVHGLRVALTLE